MAKTITFPNRPCPKCGQPIHIKTKKHEDCGWVADGQVAVAPVSSKRVSKVKKQTGQAAGGAITMQDIEAVKALVDRMGADKVRELAAVLAK